MTVSFSGHARIILGSSSHPARIGRALEMTFPLFSRNFGQIWDSYYFSWQAQYYGEVGGRHMLFRVLNIGLHM